jgi:hypothetical protein
MPVAVPERRMGAMLYAQGRPNQKAAENPK